MDVAQIIEKRFIPEIIVDKNSPDPLHLQLANSISKSIVKHRLKAGTALPYESWVAEEFSINRNTVHRAYGKLITDGFAQELNGRRGIFVADTAKKKYMSPFPGIGIITSNNFSDFIYKSSQNSLAYFSGIIDRATETKHSAVFLHLPNTQDTVEIQRWVDDTIPRLSGIVHFGRGPSQSNLPLRILLEYKQIPQVLISGYSMIPNISNVCGDVLSGGMSAAELLMNNGHRRIGMITGVFSRGKNDFFVQYAEDRPRIMAECFMKCNLKTDPKWICPFDGKSDRLATSIRKILGMKEHPTAFWCQNDIIAIETINVLNSFGLNVPGDISIIGFDDVREGSVSNPPLTTIRLPCYSIGRQAVDLLMDLFENGSPGDARNEKIPTSLVIRESVGKVTGGQ